MQLTDKISHGLVDLFESIDIILVCCTCICSSMHQNLSKLRVIVVILLHIFTKPLDIHLGSVWIQLKTEN